MRSAIHEEFVKAIKQSVLEKDVAIMKFEKDRIVSIISDVLCLGREAVYRRLRGDVKFSLEEISQLALELDISIDALIGQKDNQRSVIEMNLIEPKADFVESYHRKIKEYSLLWKKIAQKDNNASIISAFNKLPYIFYLHFENIAKFRLFKWAYQMRLIRDISFEEMDISKELVQAQVNFILEIQKVKDTSLILGPSVFLSFINDVNYFYNLGLIDKNNVLNIKHELNELLSEMEKLSIFGMYNSSKTDVRLYISNLEIDSTYILFKYNNFHYSHVNVYDLGGIESQNKKLCESHVMWINSLKRYSTLITQSNEIERYHFFQEQRQSINNESFFSVEMKR